jgi:hypothetical protein
VSSKRGINVKVYFKGSAYFSNVFFATFHTSLASIFMYCWFTPIVAILITLQTPHCTQNLSSLIFHYNLPSVKHFIAIDVNEIWILWALTYSKLCSNIFLEKLQSLIWATCKLQVVLSRTQTNNFYCRLPVPNFIQIRSVVSEIKHADLQARHTHCAFILWTLCK